MKYLITAVVAAVVAGAGSYAALGALAPQGWHGEKLPLVPVPVVAEEPVAPRTGRRARRPSPRKSRIKPKSASKSTPAPTPAAPEKGTAPPTPPPPTPSKAMEHYSAAMAHMKAKKIGLSIQELEACIALDPKFAPAYRSLGIAHTLLGRERAATEAFETFVKLAPGHRDTPRIKQIIADHYRRHPK